MLKGQEVYWTRIIPKLGIYDVIDLKIRTVEDGWFCGTDKNSKQAYLFENEAIGENVFLNRKEAVAHTKEAEKHKIEVNDERYYEEY